MNELPGQILREIVLWRHKVTAIEGHDPLAHAPTCRKLLQSRCGPGYLTEINVLTAAVRDQIPAALGSFASDEPVADYLEALSLQLAEHCAMREDAARWAVLVWAKALGLPVPPQNSAESPPSPHPSVSPHKPEAWSFFSSLRMRVLVREQKDRLSQWSVRGETPGELLIPENYAVGVQPEDLDYTQLKLWASSFEMPERIAYLDLSARPIDDVSLKDLTVFTGLEALNLSSTRVSGDGFVHLASLPLKELSLSNCRMVSDQALRGVGELSQLRHLDLADCTGIAGEGLHHLRHLLDLQRLYLDGCSALQDSALEPLAVLPQLESLDLSGTSVSGVGFLYFRNNRTVRELGLEGCSRLNTANVAHLWHLTFLEVLYLGDTAIDDLALDYLAALPRLRRLHLYNCRNLTETAIMALPARIAVFRDVRPRTSGVSNS